MITGELKNKINNLWEIFWTGGITNPLDVVEQMTPGPDEVICDPACGTSGFLVAAGEYLKERRREEIFFDREMYSLILANPPFKGSLNADTVSASLLKLCKTKKTEYVPWSTRPPARSSPGCMSWRRRSRRAWRN